MRDSKFPRYSLGLRDRIKSPWHMVRRKRSYRIRILWS